MKGKTSAELTLQFLGGEIDGQSLKISGMPRFTIGQTDLLFVTGNGKRACPLIGMMHGRYRVQPSQDGTREYITRNDGVPLESENDVQLPQPAPAAVAQLKSAAAALSRDSFEQKIAQEVHRRALP